MAQNISQIASRLGLSRQAVSAVLSTPQSTIRVSPATRQRVLDAAEEMGYRPNSAAKAISSGRFNAVGLVMSEHHQQSTIFLEMLRGLHEVLAERSIHMTVHFVKDSQLTDEQCLPKILGESMVDGLLLNYTHAIPSRMAELIEQYELPAVWLNSKHSRNCVFIDDLAAGEAATQILLHQGHRHIAYVDSVNVGTVGEPHYSRIDRRAGYERAMRQAGLKPLLATSPDGEMHEAALVGAEKFFGNHPRVTGLIAYGVDDLWSFVRFADRHELALGVDLSMITFGEDRPVGGPEFDIMVPPMNQVGRAAGEMLLRRIDDGRKGQAPVAVPMTYCRGKTVGACAGDKAAENTIISAGVCASTAR